ASIVRQPRTLDPSKPRPSSKTSSFNSEIGAEKCCQEPWMSQNLKSTIFTPLPFANSMTSFGVFGVMSFLQKQVCGNANAGLERLSRFANRSTALRTIHPAPRVPSGQSSGNLSKIDHFRRRADNFAHRSVVDIGDAIRTTFGFDASTKRHSAHRQ